jgi:hypothetical protein
VSAVRILANVNPQVRPGEYLSNNWSDGATHQKRSDLGLRTRRPERLRKPAREIYLRERAQGRSSRWAPPISNTNGSPVVRMVFEPAKQSRAFDALQEVPKMGPKSLQRRTEMFCVP